MKAMSPLPLNLQMDHSSSTESAHDQSEQNRKSDHRRRPSKIPLPGMKSYAAPKPPVGKQSPGSGTRSRSGGSPGRPNSSQSWRSKSETVNSFSGSKSNTSLSGGNKSRNGSLTTVKSNKDSLKTRDSLTGKLRSNDSLSKLRDSSVGNSFGSSKNSPTKQPSAKTSGTPVRRVSSSGSRGGRDSPDMKVRPKLQFWTNWLKLQVDGQFIIHYSLNLWLQPIPHKFSIHFRSNSNSRKFELVFFLFICFFGPGCDDQTVQ